ncbi:hypothetical protein F4775DRAFT_520085 [Biscogniauxia sp. FL1348]|nr:hypothetical protein F4775DRAFT_520085 [Biscogniauxia sp. FL1348]
MSSEHDHTDSGIPWTLHPKMFNQHTFTPTSTRYCGLPHLSVSLFAACSVSARNPAFSGSDQAGIYIISSTCVSRTFECEHFPTHHGEHTLFSCIIELLARQSGSTFLFFSDRAFPTLGSLTQKLSDRGKGISWIGNASFYFSLSLPFLLVLVNFLRPSYVFPLGYEIGTGCGKWIMYMNRDAI